MGGIEAGVAIFLLIAFIGGIAIGGIAIVSFASRREDKLHSLTGQAPGPVCQGARILTGLGVRGTGFYSAAPRPGYDGDEGPQGQEPQW